MESKAAQKYLTRFQRALVCPRRDRRRLLATEEKLLSDFLEETPGARYDDLTCAFGRPEDLAGDILSQMEPEVVEGARKQRKYIRWGIAALVVALLVSFSTFWYSKWAKAQDVINGDFYIVEGEAEKLTDEEARQLEQKMLEESQNQPGG